MKHCYICRQEIASGMVVDASCVDKLRAEIERLSLENERLKAENMKLKEEGHNRVKKLRTIEERRMFFSQQL